MQALAIPAFSAGGALGGPIGAVMAATGTLMATGMGGARSAALPRPVVRDDASSMLAANDAIAARKGGASDVLNGDAGFSQPMPGPKMVLGQ